MSQTNGISWLNIWRYFPGVPLLSVLLKVHVMSQLLTFGKILECLSNSIFVNISHCVSQKCYNCFLGNIDIDNGSFHNNNYV